MKPDIYKICDRTPKLVEEDRCFKAAVCISLLPKEEDYEVLFEVRSPNIPHQPGDICFPGGAVEPGESYRDAAVRETCEELLIGPEQIEILGPSDIMHTDTSIIYPYVGVIKDYQGTFHKNEVAEVFSVPLSFFTETEPARYQVKIKVEPQEGFPYELINGGKNYKWRKRQIDQLFYQYDGHVIWGLTARMLYAFTKAITESL